MKYSKTDAIKQMNMWGARRIPFLFIIDYPMQAIELIRLDLPQPGRIAFSFHETIQENQGKYGNAFFFRKFPIAFSAYEKAFFLVQKEIYEGNSFLVNLTFPTLLETNLTLKDIYTYSKAPYKVLVDDQFVCFSPETFVRIDHGQITACPMKGTINASIPNAEKLVLESRKETAEHYTIVDLLRNDLSMVAKKVTVNRFRYVDRIESNKGAILQVSSAISGVLDPNFNQKLGDIFFTLLPAGSVTGAPKMKTMKIIQCAEQEERGYYTGVVGVFNGTNLDSAVMIRFIEMRDGKLFYRSGGGITAMSNAREEYDELLDKIYVPIT
jgi:para-aminobenzoate synthetase component 1